MYGDNAERAAPPALRRLLLRYGGSSPTGLPMWRLVRSGDCRILCQGRIHHFPRNLDALMAEHDEGDHVRCDFRPLPDRIGGGVMWLPRYSNIPAHAWLLQKWFPPSSWGTPAEWRNHRSEDADTPIFVQQFPEQGDYFMMAGPWDSPPLESDLKAAIQLYLGRLLHRQRDPEAVVRQMMAEEVREREQRLEWLEREINRAQVEMDSVLKSVGGDAQAARNELAARAGVAGHLSASEDWG